MVQQHIILLILIASLGFTYCGITEWPLTLHHGIQGNGLEDNYVDGVPLLDPPYHSAGYMPLNNTEDAKLFYFYFQERSKDPDAPLLFWTNGGPGCSSMFGLFMENGPYVIQEDLTLKWRKYGWDVGQNVIFVDQPVGTGFSEGKAKDYAHYEDTVGEDVLVFFLEFMDLHPELKGKDLYLSGESYAGHYLPAIASSITKANSRGKFEHLNLKGVLMGNPWTSPVPVTLSYPDFAESHGLISKEVADDIRAHTLQCQKAGRLCDSTRDIYFCKLASNACNGYFFDGVLREVPDLNVYDIRKKCVGDLCYNTALLTNFLNSDEVKKQLGVDKGWTDCDNKVYRYMEGDEFISMGPVVEELLNTGLRIIVYIGDQDFSCNWMGNKVWIDSMKWNKADQWKGSLKKWEISEKKGHKKKAVGECESVEPLTFCKIYGAGHMVPMDQPKSAIAMLHTFIAGDSFVKPDPSVSEGAEVINIS